MADRKPPFGPAMLQRAVFLLGGALLLASPTRGQVVRGALDTVTAVVDSGDVASSARGAQARFERLRIRYLPRTYGSFGGSCDEVVGRICVTFGEGEWYPEPEAPEIVEARRALIGELDSLQALAPRDGWILGQRVWYRAEAGAWEEALATARSCGADRRWWCLALEGLALHGLGRYRRSQAAFDEALSRMDPDRAMRWATPRWPVDGRVRELLDEARAEDSEGGGESGDQGDRLRSLVDRLWALADPLYLVEGNDRRTAHLARWTATEIRDGARNPFRLRWGDDLSELTVRHGWQKGWERLPARSSSYQDQVIGHDDPLGRDYMPAGDVVLSPAATEAVAMVPRVRRPRSLYAPRYAPVLLPMDGQLAVFPRGETMVVASSHFLPEDTTYHASHDHPKPWLEPGNQASRPAEMGLFALPVGAPRSMPSIQGVRRIGATEGSLALEIANRDHVISAETWSPPLRRAGRLRVGVEARPVVPDIPTLSDLILLRVGGEEPRRLQEAVSLLLPRPIVSPDERFAVAWEVVGLGFRQETLGFEVSLIRVDRGVLQRLGAFLGIVDPPSALTVSWDEPSPDDPVHVFRHVELDPPTLEAGTYEVQLRLRIAGRSDVVSSTRFQVLPGP